MEGQSLSIAQCVPPSLPIGDHLKYAGTERVVGWLNESFSRLGHKSIVAAAGDSKLNGHGTLFPLVERSLWSYTGKGNRKILLKDEHRLACDASYGKAFDEFKNSNIDILQDHLGSGVILSSNYSKQKSEVNFPIANLLHGSVSKRAEWKYDGWRKLQKEKYPIFFSAISNSQRSILERKSGLEISRVIHHGVPVDSIPFVHAKKNYLFWIGRINHEKGTDMAIRVAKRYGATLILAGEVHSPDNEFFFKHVNPYIDRKIESVSQDKHEKMLNEFIEKLEDDENVIDEGEILYVGPVNNRQKYALMGNAKALIMPNRWEEPFGLVMVEAMGTGTPVIGTKLGSIPEVVNDKNTGYVIPVEKDREGKLCEETVVRDMCSSLDIIGGISRCKCRSHVEKHFDIIRMGSEYINYYNDILLGRI